MWFVFGHVTVIVMWCRIVPVIDSVGKHMYLC